MSLMKEFKSFAMRGNVVDLAVGIIIGGAFGKIVSSMVNDLLMPVVGLILGGADTTSWMITLKSATETSPAVFFRYGVFINAIIDFLIIAFSIFMIIKLINNLKKKEEAAPAAPPKPTAEEKLLQEIRDILKSK